MAQLAAICSWLMRDPAAAAIRRRHGSSASISPSTIARVRKRFVTEGFGAALDHRPQPPRPEKVKLIYSIEKELIEWL